MKSNKRGFTLIELLATVAILTVIMSLAVITFININITTLENEYKNVVSYIETKAAVYAKETGYLEVSVETLINEGYLPADDQTDIYDPRDKSSLNCHLVTMTYDEYGEYSSSYQESAYSSKDSDGNCAPYEALSALDLFINGTVKLENKWYNRDLSLTLKKNSGEDFFENETILWQLTNGSTYNTEVVEVSTSENGFVDTVAEVILNEDGKPKYRIVRNIKIDKINPTIVAIDYEKGWTKGTEKEVAITLNDNESGIYGIKIVKNNTCSGVTYEELNGNTSYKAYLGIGEYYACVMDNAGNVTKSNAFTIDNLDDSIPSIDSFTISSVSTLYNSNTVNITASASDVTPGSGVSEICITTLEDYTMCIWQPAINNTLVLNNHVLDSDEGSGETLNVKAYAKDGAGNVSLPFTISYTLYQECVNNDNLNTTYGDYTTCSVTCGGGTRSRTVVKTDKFTSNICLNSTENDTCNNTPCCSEGTYSPVSCTSGYIRERRYNSCTSSYEYKTTTTTCENVNANKCYNKSAVSISYCTSTRCYTSSGTSYLKTSIKDINVGSYENYDCTSSKVRQRRYNDCTEAYEYTTTTSSCETVASYKCVTAQNSEVYINWCTSSTCYASNGLSYSASSLSNITYGAYTDYECNSSGKLRQKRVNNCTGSYEYTTTTTSCSNLNTTKCDTSAHITRTISWCTSSTCYDSSGNAYPASTITDVNVGTYANYDCQNSKVRQRRYNECTLTYEYNTTTTSCTSYEAYRCNSGTSSSVYIKYCTSSYCYDSSGTRYTASNIKDISYCCSTGTYAAYDCSSGKVRNRKYNECTGVYDYETTTTSCTSYDTYRCNTSTKSSIYITYCTSSLCYDSSGTRYTASYITTLDEGTYAAYDCSGGKLRNRRYNNCKGAYEYQTTTTSCTDYSTPMCNTSTKSSIYITYCTSSLCYDSSGNSYSASNITTLNEGTYANYDCQSSKVRQRRYNSCTGVYEYKTTTTSCTSYNTPRCNTANHTEVTISYCTSSYCYDSSGNSYTASNIKDITYGSYEDYDCQNSKVRQRRYNNCTLSYEYKTTTTSCTSYNTNRCNTSTKSSIYITYCTSSLCYDSSGNSYTASNITTLNEGTYANYDCSSSKVRQRRYNSCKGVYEYNTTTTSCTSYNTNRCYTTSKKVVYITYCTSSYCYDSSGTSYTASKVTTYTEGTYSLYDCSGGKVRNRRYNSCTQTYEYETTATGCDVINGYRCYKTTKTRIYLTWCTTDTCYGSSTSDSYVRSNIRADGNAYCCTPTYTDYDCQGGKIRQIKSNNCGNGDNYVTTTRTCSAINGTRCNKSTGGKVYVTYCNGTSNSEYCYTSNGGSVLRSNLAAESNSACNVCSSTKNGNYSGWTTNYSNCWDGYYWKYRTYDKISTVDNKTVCESGLVENANAYISCGSSGGGSSSDSTGKWILQYACGTKTYYLSYSSQSSCNYAANYEKLCSSGVMSQAVCYQE